MSTVLQVRDLTVELGGREVLHDVELTVGDGETVGLIGPNGAGKTTLLRSVLGLVAPTRGSVVIDGADPGRRRGTVGYVPQRHEFSWDYPISVRAAVLSGTVHRRRWLRRASADDRAAVAEALERVAMTPLANRPVGELSGGQRQRVLVARALALRPRLLLLDEPFTGLDVPTQEMLTDLFGRLRGEGNALVTTTHDLAAASEMCTRLCLLNRTVVADAPPDGLTDPEIWLRAFGVTRSQQLLRTLSDPGESR
ncbi:anchored repeat-type ABC transporter ATP-binding subunit [Pseudonocardia phyllosphaerae]|uniref:anchored repeat-type ABC transporter ATP-binding subunit n=1 Tax=Pseudonocardia phyllosphaerae TaxID=3390502 RepID=UPI00397DE4D2